MPCNCDYLEPMHIEREASKALCLLDELDAAAKFGPSLEFRHHGGHWNGFHPKAYSQASQQLVDGLTAALCGKLQELGDDVNKYSLELQTWWRDHKDGDRIRLETELKAAKEGQVRAEALAKLTPYERELLGVGQ